RHEVEVDGAGVELSPKEFGLLHILMANAGRVVSREMLLEKIWGQDFYGDDRTVDVHIRWLREKIEPDPSTPSRLVTIRGLGYKLRGRPNW
ncbi:MAG: winged helix-turn-helix domain-containing protein, partial [bacterium]|nr:winged helix-turn-helix domain-containing protein [bacterium]